MFKKYLAAAATALVLLHPSIACARQWVMVGESDNSILKVDVDSIKGEGDTRTFWSDVVYSEERSASSSSYGFHERKYKSVKTLNFVDCTENKIGVLRTILYDSNGNVVDDYDVSYLSTPQNLKYTIPDSIGETELLYVCGLRTANRGRKYNTPSSFSSPKINTATVSQNFSFPKRKLWRSIS